VLPAGVYFFYYHDVSDSPHVPLSIRTTPDRFKREISVIGRHFETVSLQDGIDAIGSTKKRLAVLSFDDGFRSILDIVPLIERAGLPYTMFANAAFVDQVRVSDAVLLHAAERIGAEFTDRRPTETLREYGRRRSGPEFSAELHDRFGGDLLDKRIFLDEAGIRQIERSHLFGLGNHTFGHHWLSNLDDATLLDEVKLGHEAMSSFDSYSGFMAIPFGSNDSFDDRIVPLVHRFSRGALIKASGGISHRRSKEILEIERIGLSSLKPDFLRHVRQRISRPSLTDRTVGLARRVGLSALGR
jgi:peptidoglycan/xylan/chitin deacetylase (PgdA/CDA1 family)